MNFEQYETWCLKRIAHGHSIVLRKAVPKKKSPTGKAIPAVKQQVPGVTSKVLLGKTAQNAMRSGELELEAALMKMRKSRVIICTNGMWWAP